MKNEFCLLDMFVFILWEGKNFLFNELVDNLEKFFFGFNYLKFCICGGNFGIYWKYYVGIK